MGCIVVATEGTTCALHNQLHCPHSGAYGVLPGYFHHIKITQMCFRIYMKTAVTTSIVTRDGTPSKCHNRRSRYKPSINHSADCWWEKEKEGKPWDDPALCLHCCYCSSTSDNQLSKSVIMCCCPNKWKTLLSHKGGSGWHLRPAAVTSSKIYTVDVVMRQVWTGDMPWVRWMWPSGCEHHVRWIGVWCLLTLVVAIDSDSCNVAVDICVQ